jgi:hypothetical protein
VGSVLKKTAGLLAGVLTATAVTAGCASASSAAEPSRAASAAKTHLAIWSVNSDGLGFHAILTGPIGDHGTGRSTRNRKQTLLTLTRGTFRLNTARIDSDFVHHVTRWPYDQATCSIHGSLTDPVPIVPGSGTGAYRKISGTFTLTITLYEDWQRKPGCNETTPFQAQLITIEGAGSINP